MPAVPAGLVPPVVDVLFLVGVARVDRFLLGDVILDASQVEDGFRWEASLGQAQDLGRVLGEDEVEVGQQRAHDASKLAVAFLARVAEASIDEVDRDAAALGAPKVVRPDLGLDQYDDLRANELEGVNDGPEKINRVVDDDGLVIGKPLLRERIAGAGGGGDDDARLGPHLAQAQEQDAGNFDFADADGVDPEIGAGRELFLHGLRVIPEALAELGQKFSAAPQAIEKKEPRDQEERHEANVVEHLQGEFEKRFHARGWA